MSEQEPKDMQDTIGDAAEEQEVRESEIQGRADSDPGDALSRIPIPFEAFVSQLAVGGGLAATFSFLAFYGAWSYAGGLFGSIGIPHSVIPFSQGFDYFPLPAMTFATLFIAAVVAGYACARAGLPTILQRLYHFLPVPAVVGMFIAVSGGSGGTVLMCCGWGAFAIGVYAVQLNNISASWAFQVALTIVFALGCYGFSFQTNGKEQAAMLLADKSSSTWPTVTLTMKEKGRFPELIGKTTKLAFVDSQAYFVVIDSDVNRVRTIAISRDDVSVLSIEHPKAVSSVKEVGE